MAGIWLEDVLKQKLILHSGQFIANAVKMANLRCCKRLGSQMYFNWEMITFSNNLTNISNSISVHLVTHNFTESQKHIITEELKLEGTTWDQLVPLPCFKQGHCPGSHLDWF